MLKFHSSLDATIETAANDDKGRMRIKGVANSMKIMRSGRVFMPQAFARFFQEHGNVVNLPLMTQHGFGHHLPLIGRVDRMSVDPQRGLVFEAFVGGSTQLTDEVRALVAQGILNQVSLGWMSSHESRRLIPLEEAADQYPELAAEMERTGHKRVMAFFAAEPYEVSMVDVPDDPNAVLAAGLPDGGIDFVTAKLDEMAADFKARLDRFESEMVEHIKSELTLACEKVIETDTAYADGCLDASDADCTHGAADDHNDEASLGQFADRLTAMLKDRLGLKDPAA